jgi:hypothetical protein
LRLFISSCLLAICCMRFSLSRSCSIIIRIRSSTSRCWSSIFCISSVLFSFCRSTSSKTSDNCSKSSALSSWAWLR